MSTKISIKSHTEGDRGFDLYRECFEDEDTGPVYLSLSGVKFTADSEGNVVVQIPRDWAVRLQLPTAVP